MWAVSFWVIVVSLVCCLNWIRKWANPKCDGVLPPGSMGLPFIGETIQFMTPSYSLDTHPFITKRIKRYGLIFRTSLAGQRFVVSADQEFNNYILQQEGRSVELWYLNTFSRLLWMEGKSRLNEVGNVHKYIRGTLLNHFGHEMLKKTFPDIQMLVQKSLEEWSSQPSVDVKKATSAMLFKFSVMRLFGGYPFEASPEVMSERFSKIFQGLLSFPLDVPLATYHECIKEHGRIMSILKGILKDRLSSGKATHHGDLIDHLIDGMKHQEFLTEDAVIKLMFGTLFASFESISNVTTFLLKILSENDGVIEELRAEHASIVARREKWQSSITWDEYKSMTFTNQVINEIPRLANLVPGIFRRAVKDIHMKGMTIPAGWGIFMLSSTVHMNPDLFVRPLEFNPWRWKEIDSYTASKNFMPFGGGMRQCVGADYSRVFLFMFIHVLITNFRWTKIKGGDVYRNPLLAFKDGLHVKFSKSNIY